MQTVLCLNIFEGVYVYVEPAPVKPCVWILKKLECFAHISHCVFSLKRNKSLHIENQNSRMRFYIFLWDKALYFKPSNVRRADLHQIWSNGKSRIEIYGKLKSKIFWHIYQLFYNYVQYIDSKNA